MCRIFSISQIATCSLDKKTQLLDLNLDCQLQILNEMDFASLIALSETSKHFSMLIPEVMKRKLAYKFLAFTMSNGGNQHIRETNKLIRIMNFQQVTKILHNFGSLISNIRVDALRNNETKLIYRYINSYCSDTLKQFEIRYAYENIFDEFTVPFRNVHSVIMRGNLEKLHKSKRQFNELFPALQKLTFKKVSIDEMSWFDLTFPRLEYFYLDILNVCDFANIFPESVTEKFLKKNPQIRSLVLRLVSRKMLIRVADLVPNLESLEINSYFETDEEGADDAIHFDYLKALRMRQSSWTMSRNLHLKNIEELEIDATHAECFRWIEFVEENRSLLRLRVTDRYLNDYEISRLAMANLSMVEISAGFSREVKDETMVNFIEMNKNLKKLHLIKSFDPTLNGNDENSSIQSTMTAIRNKFEDQWNINETYSEIFLERMA